MDHSRKAALQVRSLMIHMNEHKPNPTQAEKVLKVLQDAKGEYVNGRYFIYNELAIKYFGEFAKLNEICQKSPERL